MIPCHDAEGVVLKLRQTCGAGARGATRLARIDMPAIAAARRISEIGERDAIGCIIYVHTVAKAVVRECVERRVENARDGAQRDVSYVIKQSPAVRIAGGVASKQT